MYVFSGVRPLGESAVVVSRDGGATLIVTPAWDRERVAAIADTDKVVATDDLVESLGAELEASHLNRGRLAVVAMSKQRRSLAREVFLAEHHVAVGAVERPPLRDAALRCPPHTRANLGMATAQFFENGHRADAGCGLKHRHDLALPYADERVGTPAGARFCFLRRQPRIGFDPVR